MKFGKYTYIDFQTIIENNLLKNILNCKMSAIFNLVFNCYLTCRGDEAAKWVKKTQYV